MYGGLLDGRRCWQLLRWQTCWKIELLAVSVLQLVLSAAMVLVLIVRPSLAWQQQSVLLGVEHARMWLAVGVYTRAIG